MISLIDDSKTMKSIDNLVLAVGGRVEEDGGIVIENECLDTGSIG